MSKTSAAPSTRNPVARVIELNPHTDPRWQDFVHDQPCALIYHYPAWLQVLQTAYGRELLCLACEGTDGNLCGILPLSRQNGLLTGRRLSSLPHTPVAGPLATDEHATVALVQAAISRMREEDARQLQIKAPAGTLVGLVDGLVGVPWETTYTLSLAETPAELRFGSSRNHAGIRRAVNKAAKHGVEIRPAETEGELRAWYVLYLETMRWHAVPPRPYRFFRACWNILRPEGMMRLLLAEQCQGGQRRLLAGSIFLMDGQTVFYAFNGRHRQDLGLRPNDAIHWQAIQDARRDGYHVYDFGEVGLANEGLARYKSKWGATPGQLYRYYYPVGGEVETRILKGGTPARNLVNAVWRRLPLKATALLGDWIYEHL